MVDIDKIREDFPILGREVYGRPLVYLDNAASTQKPSSVIDGMSEMYRTVYSNVHRGVHLLSQESTEMYELSRKKVQAFLNAQSSNEIIFTRGTTESINLVARCFSDEFMKEGDEVIVSAVEHHSNIVPWQLAARCKGIVLKVIPVSDGGVLDVEAYRKLFTERTRIVSIAHVSNVLGTVNPVKEFINIAHEHGVPVLVDGAQSTPHFKVDVQDLDCDFLAFSGHKVYGPTGIGVLYGKEEWLEKLPPYMGGGEMIDHVSWDGTTFEHAPLKFEAGTPDFVGAYGLGLALDYVMNIGMDEIEAHEHQLTEYARERLSVIEGMHLFGTDGPHSGVWSFQLKADSGDIIHHLDLGTLLDRLGIAVRTGHHCAEPLMDRLGVSGTVRASFGIYNTQEDIDRLAAGIQRVRGMF